MPEQRLGEFSFADSAAARWQSADVAEGLPQVYAATSEVFVAQMLNLDLLGAIAFDKGCYTGQEVIARSHYRGRVKRRLQRWSTDTSTPLRAGDAARSVDGRALSIVRVAPLRDAARNCWRWDRTLVSEDAHAAESRSAGRLGRAARRAAAAALSSAGVGFCRNGLPNGAARLILSGARTTPAPGRIRRRAPG